MDNDRTIEYQLLEQQMQSLSENLQNIEESVDELMRITNALDGFNDLKVGDKILVSLANGIFAEAELKVVNSLKVNVGSGVMVSKDVVETKKMIQDKLKDLNDYKKEAEQYYETMYSKIQEIHQEMIAEESAKK